MLHEFLQNIPLKSYNNLDFGFLVKNDHKRRKSKAKKKLYLKGNHMSNGHLQNFGGPREAGRADLDNRGTGRVESNSITDQN
jgi:hypothetical protein